MDTNMPNDLQFNKYYQKHLKCLQLNGLQPKTVQSLFKGDQAHRQLFRRIDDLSSDRLLDHILQKLIIQV